MCDCVAVGDGWVYVDGSKLPYLDSFADLVVQAC